MIELPEALTIANQINDRVYGKRITNVIVAHTPHKFAWYHEDPQKYHDLLSGKTIDKASGYKTKLSKNTVDKPCPVCGNIIKKEAYMGGSIYFCPTCQKL